MPILSRKRGRAAAVQQDSDTDRGNTPPQRRRLAAPAASQATQRRLPQAQTQRARDDSDDEEEEYDGYHEGEEGQRDQGEVNRDRLVQKLVRLALANEFNRQPIRRTEITTKVLGTENSRMFKSVFEQTQLELRKVFGMELVELPARDKITLTQKRAAQRSEKGPSQSSKSYMLSTTLPAEYRIPEILGAGSAMVKEEAYVGLVTTICTLIYLNGRQLPESKLDRYLRRLNIEINTPVEKTEKLLATMCKQGYLIRVKESTGGETVFEYHLGPRAKMEVGKPGVVNFLQEVYGVQVPEDLEARVEQNIGIDEVASEITERAKKPPGQQRKRRAEKEEEEESDDDSD